MRQLVYRAFALVAAVAAHAALAEPRIIDVPLGGDIASAISGANSGDVVRLAAGTYTKGLGTIDKAITLRGAGRSLTRIVASGRLAYLKDPGAVVSDLTLSGGSASTSGGGVRIDAGTLQDVIVANCKTTGAANGGGIYIVGGTVRRCVVTGCMAGGNYGGGICVGTTVSDVRLESALVYGNDTGAAGYGGLYVPANAVVTVVNCTFAGNMSRGTPSDTGCSSEQCHYLNTYRGVAGGTKGTYDNSPDSVSVPTPGFVNPNGGIYRLAPTSPLCGAGGTTDALWDVDGNPMPATPSIGACQPTNCLVPAQAGVLLGGSVDVTVGFPAGASGAGVLSVVSPDATVAAQAVEDGDTVTVAAEQLGAYSLVLDVTAGSDSVRIELINAFSVSVAEAFVDPLSKNPVAPYSTPATAAKTVGDALAVVERGTIWICDGTYSVSSTIGVYRPVTIRGLNGPAGAVFLQAAGVRIFELGDPEAKLSHLTIRGDGTGYAKNGMGIAVLTAGGAAADCIIENFVDSHTSDGGAVNVSGPARFDRCVIRNSSTQRYGGGLSSSGYVELRDCLFYGNQAKQNSGAAIYVTGPGLMVNCTVYGNFLTATSGNQCEFYRKSDNFAVTNCILGSAYWNKKTGNAACNLYGTAADPVPDSIFEDAENDDYRLKASAFSAIDQGDDEAVFDGETDLAGAGRISGDHVDIGCYEFDDIEFTSAFTVEGTAAAVGDTVKLVPVVTGAQDPVSSWRVVNLCGGPDLVGETTGVGEAGAFTVSFPAPGVYSFQQIVRAGANGSTNWLAEAVTVMSDATEIYVAMPGASAPSAPFDTPATAATNLWAAVKALPENAMAYVLPGTHRVARRVRVDGGRRVIGAGRDTCVVTVGDASRFGAFEIAHAQSSVSTLAVTGGTVANYGDGRGFGVRITAGLLADCLLTNLVMRSAEYGSALAVIGKDSRASHVEVRGCRNERERATLYLKGDVKLDNLLVVDNTATMYDALYLDYNSNESKGSFTNCTFVGNCYVGKLDARFVNCLFDASIAIDRNGVDVFRNCNFTQNAPEEHFAENDNLSVEEPDVGFVSLARGDYRLRVDSPLRAAGLYEPSMRFLSDLAGCRRTRANTVAIGCYQPVPGGLAVIVR